MTLSNFGGHKYRYSCLLNEKSTPECCVLSFINNFARWIYCCCAESVWRQGSSNHLHGGQAGRPPSRGVWCPSRTSPRGTSCTRPTVGCIVKELVLNNYLYIGQIHGQHHYVLV